MVSLLGTVSSIAVVLPLAAFVAAGPKGLGLDCGEDTSIQIRRIQCDRAGHFVRVPSHLEQQLFFHCDLATILKSIAIQPYGDVCGSAHPPAKV